jgi:signal recognition particle receptor subunit beta
MPIIDNKRGVLVVRVVYDGPPLSGKTTSLRTLARGLGVQVTTPEEQDGRTLFFDWIDYVGGLFEGRQIRCQIVSVPGQDEFAARRRELLASADAVVLVADTRRPALPEAFAVLRSLWPHCRSQQPPIGVVLQANKRDAVDSVPRDELQAELGAIAPLAIVETVATAGDGIREAFVFGVRLALDRVRAFADAGMLPVGEPDVDDPAELLERLKAISVPPAGGPCANDGASVEPQRVAESSPPPSAPASEVAMHFPTRNSVPTAPVADEKPFVPDPLMPGGFIWPPVDGRVALHEVAKFEVIPQRTGRGDWWASGQGCLFHSAGSAIYDDADTGRQALIEWARLHATHARRLSSGRTVILADAGSGRFRLWQLVRVEAALRESLSLSSLDAGVEHMARDLHEAATHVLQARAVLHSEELRLPCTLWTISANLQTQPRFVGLMPANGSDDPVELAGVELLTRELSPLLRALQSNSDGFRQLVDAVCAARAHRPGHPAANALAEVVLAIDQSNANARRSA